MLTIRLASNSIHSEKFIFEYSAYPSASHFSTA